MKQVIIKNAQLFEQKTNWENTPHFEAEGENLEISDGYHTMDELYEHRHVLFIKLCEKLKMATGDMSFVWRSKLHSDGTMLEGWFIFGIGKETGSQIGYHLPISYWEETNFANTLDRAPLHDGHTSSDVLDRLKKL